MISIKLSIKITLLHGRVPVVFVYLQNIFFEEHIREVASIRGIAFKERFPDSTTINWKTKKHAVDFSHQQKTPEILPFQLIAYEIFVKHFIIIIIIIIKQVRVGARDRTARGHARHVRHEARGHVKYEGT